MLPNGVMSLSWCRSCLLGLGWMFVGAVVGRIYRDGACWTLALH